MTHPLVAAEPERQKIHVTFPHWPHFDQIEALVEVMSPDEYRLICDMFAHQPARQLAADPRWRVAMGAATIARNYYDAEVAKLEEEARAATAA